MEIEDLSNESMLINPQVDSIGDTLNNNTGSQWHNKTVLYSAMIGPWYSNDTTEPLVLIDSDGGPGVAPVGTPTVALATGKDYYFRIGVKFISGMQNVGGTNIGDQVSYSVGG